LPCCSLQEESAPHGDRRLFDHCPEQAIELRPASKRPACEAAGIVLPVQGVKNDVA
jgi:hypothetical protein